MNSLLCNCCEADPEQLKRDPDKVVQELDKRLRIDLRHMGDFRSVHPMPPHSSGLLADFCARPRRKYEPRPEYSSAT